MREKEAKILMDKLREDYNSLASSFSRTRDRLWTEMKFLFNETQVNEKVLDLGCGNGRFSQYFESNNYTGVDFSERMIEEAKARFPDKKFLIADAISLPFPENSFDKVYSIALLHHIPHQKYRLQVFQEIKRVLKPGGRVAITVWDIKKGKIFYLKNIFCRPFGLRDTFLKRQKYYYIFAKGELSFLAKKAGLEIIKEGVVKEKRRSNLYLIAIKSIDKKSKKSKICP